MKLSIDTLTLHRRYGDEKTIQMMKEAGFDGVDYDYCFLDEGDEALSDDYAEYAHKVRKLLEESHMVCYQAHAPLSISYGSAFEESVEGYRRIVRSIEAASILGAEHIVVHALKVPEGVDDFAYNLEYYKSFEPYCKKFGIHIAIENLGKYRVGRFNTPEILYKMLDVLDSPWYTVCVDVGHAAVTGPEPEELIEGLDHKTLRCLHIHDNDYEHDNHALPYTGKLNWDNITTALKKINYQECFSLEIPTYLGKFDDEMMQEALNFAAKIGRHLIDKIVR